MTLVLWQFFEFPVRAEAAAAYCHPAASPSPSPVLACSAGSSAAEATSRSPARAASGGRRSSAPGAGSMLAYALFVVALAVIFSLRGAGAGRFQQGLGTRLQLGESDARTISARCSSSYNSRATDHPPQLHLFRRSGLLCRRARADRRLYRHTAAWCTRGNVLTVLCMAPLVIPGIVLASASMPPTRPRRSPSMAPPTILVIGYTTRFLPIAYVNAAAGCARSTRRWRKPSASSAAAACAPLRRSSCRC